MARPRGTDETKPEPGSLQAVVFEREESLERGAQIAAAKLLEKIRDASGKLNQSEAARQTGMDQQTLSALKNGEKIGIRNALKIAVASGLSLDQLQNLRKDSAVVPIKRGMIVLGESAGWAEAVETARANHSAVQEWAWRAAGGVTLPLLPKQITPELAFATAVFVETHCEVSQEIRVRRKRAKTE